MAGLRYVGTLGTGIDAFDQALADLEIVDSSGGPVLAAIAAAGGGLATYAIGPDGTTLADTTTLAATVQAGQRPALVDLGEGALLVSGANVDSVTRLTLDDAGQIRGAEGQGGISGAVQASEAVLLAGDTLVMAGPNRAATQVYASAGAGALSPRGEITDTGATHADAVSALAAGAGGADRVLLVGSQSEYGVTAYRAGPDGLAAAGSVGPAQGLGIMAPSAIATLEIGTASYAIVASTAGAGGGGALSVLRVAADGALTPTDHVLDTRESRFGAAQCAAAVEIEGRGFVVAGGGDHGLSLFALTPDGRLIHLQSLEDTPAMGLGGATDIELVVAGDRLEVYVITEADAGIAHFRVDIGALGASAQAAETGQVLTGTAGDDMLLGGDGRDNVFGGAGDDILVDGGEDDRLTGGTGPDLFVFVQDGMRDEILDFDPVHDRIDLTSWAFLYDTTQLEITERGGHTRITFRDERLDVASADGAPIDPETLRAAILLDVNRAFLPPSVEAHGGAAGERLGGSWGADTLMGRGGDDTIEGFQGDDVLNGGGGLDTLLLDALSGEAVIVDLDGGAFDIHSSAGVDHARAFEFFAFRDRILSAAEMQARAIRDPGEVGVASAGSPEDDLLLGGALNDTFLGTGGADTLRGGDGHDLLDGGIGPDRLVGKAGDDTLRGGTQNDTLSGGRGDDLLEGGDGRNRLGGQAGDDTLRGGEARDLLNGGGGQDDLKGFGGNDRLTGGRGGDTLDGGDDPDKLYGNAADDVLVGGAGDDLLNGGGGADRLSGGAGADYLKGGSGGDIFVYSEGGARDRIVDFDPTEDVILLGAEVHAPYETPQDLLDDLAHVTEDGIILDFEGGDQLILDDLSDLDGLAEAIHFA